MKKLSRERVAQVLRLRECGFAYPQIIEQTGVCKSAVQKYCSGLRPELRTIAYKRLPQECENEVKRLRVRGLSLRKIEKATGLSGPYIQKVCAKYCPGYSRVGFRKIDPKKLEIIERHYKDGYSTKELSVMAGCHIATVQRYLKSKGVKLPLTTKRNTVNENTIYNLYIKGLGTKEIATESGYCRDSVKRCLRKLGIRLPLRKSKEGSLNKYSGRGLKDGGRFTEKPVR